MTDNPPPRCGTCPCFVPSAGIETYSGIIKTGAGLCHLNPDPVRKIASDWCSQHPGFGSWMRLAAGAQREDGNQFESVAVDSINPAASPPLAVGGPSPARPKGGK